MEKMNAMARSSSRPPQALAALSAGSFVSEGTIEALVRANEVTRAGATLTTKSGKRFILQDAARILDRRDGMPDTFGLIGKVELLRTFLRNGAALSSDAIRFGNVIYDVEWGAIVFPVGSADESGANPKVDG